MTRKFAAAKSLFNSPERLAGQGANTLAKAALAGNVGGQEREQTVLTPDWIVEGVRQVFGGTIDLDPCAADDPATHLATVNVTKEMDGLSMPWSGCTVYSNPPYADLKPWMTKYLDEALDWGNTQIIALVPLRPQRKWFCDTIRRAGATLYTLAPFPFKGHKQAFPAPMCLITYNVPTGLELIFPGKVTGRWRLA